MPGTVRKTKMDETGEKMIKREVSVKKEEDIDDESCVNVFGEDSVIVKNEEKEFEEENLLVNPDLLKEVIFHSILKSFCFKYVSLKFERIEIDKVIYFLTKANRKNF